MLTLNFSDKLSNIKTKINYWKRRNLTRLGKITVIKSLLLSSLNHLFISLLNPNEKTMREINDLFYKFIWKGTRRIKRTVLSKEYCEGGMKMTDIDAFIAALKSTWFRKLVVTKHSQWSALL